MKALPTNQFRHQYLIYTRKSTDDTDNQKNSISHQKSETFKFAKGHKLPVADIDIEDFCKGGIVTERHTGYKENLNWKIGSDGSVNYKTVRPKFHKLVQLLYQREFKGVIILCWDRASRNKSDDSIIDKLIKHGVDIRFVQASYDKSSSGELHMDIDGMFARHYSRSISEKVRQTNTKLRDEGVCTYRAPVGYLNIGDARNKPIDPKRAPIIKRLFEKYSSENLSLQDLARWANDQGLTMGPVRRHRTEKEMLSDEEINIDPVARPITFNHLQKILRNPFYTGLIKGNEGTMVKSSSHKPLVNEKLFKAVQDKLHSKRRSVSYDNRLPHPYRGTFRCENCHRVYTPYEQKDQIYYGASCLRGCSNTYNSFNKPTIEYIVGEVLAKMHFPENIILKLQAVKRDSSTEEKKILIESQSIDRQIGKLKEDLNYLKTNKLSLLRNSVFSPESIQAEESGLLDKINSLKTQSERPKVTEAIESALCFSELSKALHLRYLLGETPQRQVIISKVFSELKLFHKNLIYKGRNGFRIFENQNYSQGGPTGWVSEAVRYNNLIKLSIAELEKIIQDQPP